jgi:hypothetical protein
VNIRTEIKRVDAALRRGPRNPVRLTEGERQLISMVRALPSAAARFMVFQTAREYLGGNRTEHRNEVAK